MPEMVGTVVLLTTASNIVLPGAPVLTVVVNLSAQLSWTTPAAGTYPIAKYIIYRNGIQWATSTSTSINDATVAAGQTYSYKVDAVDDHNNPGPFSNTVTVTIPNIALNITTTSPLPSGVVGVPYSVTLAAAGGSPPYTWSLTSGTLDTGLTLSAAGVISGTPVNVETDTITIKVTDTALVTNSKVFSLNVVAAASTFPLLGAMLYGQSGNGNYTDDAAKIARCQLIGVQGWPGWRDPKYNTDLTTAYAQWRAINPTATIIQYIMYEAYFPNNAYASNFTSDPPSGVWYEACRQIQAAKWFAYPDGLTKAGNPLPSNFGYVSPTNFYPEWNWTIYGVTYLGKTLVQWLSDFYKRVFKDGGSAQFSNGNNSLTQSANPYINGFMTDNQFWQYRIQTADYNCDGAVDTPYTNPTYQTQCRHGNKVMADYIRSIWPGVIIIGNCDVSNAVAQGVTNVAGTDWDQTYDGALNESTFGQGYSYETFGSFKNARQVYTTTMNMLRAAKLCVIMSDFILAKGYALQRYAYTFALLDNGYFFSNDPNNGGYSSKGMIMLDEYNFNLGVAIDPPQTVGKFSYESTYGSGIYVREFQYGFAICGARRSAGGTDAYTLNGDQTTPYATFTLPVNTQRLTGTQDPVTNNGAVIPANTPITMTPRNGLILKKI
jgi:hypothetical protein